MGDPLPFLVLLLVAAAVTFLLGHCHGARHEAGRWSAAAGRGPVRHGGEEYVVLTARGFGRPVLRYQNHNLKR